MRLSGRREGRLYPFLRSSTSFMATQNSCSDRALSWSMSANRLLSHAHTYTHTHTHTHTQHTQSVDDIHRNRAPVAYQIEDKSALGRRDWMKKVRAWSPCSLPRVGCSSSNCLRHLSLSSCETRHSVSGTLGCSPSTSSTTPPFSAAFNTSEKEMGGSGRAARGVFHGPG